MGPIDDHHGYIYKRFGEQDEKIERLENIIELFNNMFSELSESVLKLTARIGRLERANRMR